MNISSPKNSITKSIGPSNGIKAPSSKVVKSADATTTSNTTNTDDANVAKNEGSTWEAGQPISKGADKAAADATKAQYSAYYDYKKSELNNQRGIQQDQLNFQRQMAQQQIAQQNSQIGAGIAAQVTGALGQMIAALGQAKGAGGSSSGCSSSGGGSAGTPSPEAMDHKNGFEDQSKITKLDSKGNPIVDDPNKATSGTNGTVLQPGQSPDQQLRSSSHDDIYIAGALATDYDSDNAITIGSHIPEPEIEVTV